MSPLNTAGESGKRPARGALFTGGVCLVALVGIALLLAAGSTSLASEPGVAAGAGQVGLGSELWIVGWVAVFLALSALYSFERRHRAKVDLAAAGGARWRRAAESAPAAREARRGAGRAAGTPRRPIEQLLKRKPAAADAERSRPPVIPAPKLNLHEESTLLRRPSRRGVTEADEESFSVVDAAAPPPPPAEASAPAPAQPAQAPPPAQAPNEPGRPERCAALRAAERFEEAARVAREGLAGDDDPGPLLIELSRAELGLGRVNAAIDTARDAHFVCRSRESLSHLIRLLIETRRLGRNDGAMLRRAAARHPEQPLLRHAAGVFESMYGDPAAAERELREALRLEAEAEARAAIERDLARVRRHRQAPADQGRLAG
jgi:hypothetical protein